MDDFITDLYCLAEHCRYGALHEMLVRDCIAIGIRDRRLSEKLQMETGLTLDDIVTQAHQSEAVKKQQGIVKSDGQPENAAVGAVKAHGHNHLQQKGNIPKPPRQFKTTSAGSQPTRCGQSLGHGRMHCHMSSPKGTPWKACN